jgi:hypothetical protein
MRATAHQQIGTIAMLRGERSGAPEQCQFSRECLLSEGYELVLSKVQSDLTTVERRAATCRRVQQAGALRQMCVGAKRKAELVVQSNLAASASKTATLSSFRTREPKQNVPRGTEAMLDALARPVVPPRAAITWIERLRPTSGIAHEH